MPLIKSAMRGLKPSVVPLPVSFGLGCASLSLTGGDIAHTTARFSTERISKKCRSLSKKMQGQTILQLCYVSQAGERRAPDAQERGGIQVHAKQLMKRCARCHRKLGLGVRARNLWNGRWWVHVRFCSTHCEALYQQEQYDANAHRWRTFLARRNPQS
jgi:hypothetical protein